MQEKRDWYLPDPNGVEPQGPYTTEELKGRITAGTLRLDDYVWGTHFTDQRWRRFFEVDEFRPQEKRYPHIQQTPKKRSRGITKSIKLDYKANGAYDEKNEYRRYPRIPIDCVAVISNQDKYVHAHCVDISEKGVYLKLDGEKVFSQGEEVMVTVRNVPQIGTFSAVSVILRVSDKENQTGYGIYFLRVNPHVRRGIARLVVKHFEQKALERKGEEGAA